MTTTKTTATADTNTNTFACIPFDQISDPGCYVCNWSGHLLRVPDDGVVAGRSPVINIVGNDTLFVTKLSCNPYIPVTKAKLLAANADVNVNF